MGGDDTKRSSKHKHKHDKDEHKSKRKHKSEKESSRKRSRKDEEHLRIVDDDVADDDMWVEKNIDMDGERVRGFVLRYRGHPVHSDCVCSLWQQTYRPPRTSN